MVELTNRTDEPGQCTIVDSRTFQLQDIKHFVLV